LHLLGQRRGVAKEQVFTSAPIPIFFYRQVFPEISKTRLSQKHFPENIFPEIMGGRLGWGNVGGKIAFGKTCS